MASYWVIYVLVRVIVFILVTAAVGAIIKCCSGGKTAENVPAPPAAAQNVQPHVVIPMATTHIYPPLAQPPPIYVQSQQPGTVYASP